MTTSREILPEGGDVERVLLDLLEQGAAAQDALANAESAREVPPEQVYTYWLICGAFEGLVGNLGEMVDRVHDGTWSLEAVAKAARGARREDPRDALASVRATLDYGLMGA